MSNQDFIRSFPRSAGLSASQSLRMMHIDPILMLLLLGVVGYGLVILYSAVNQDSDIFSAQLLRMALALAAALGMGTGIAAGARLHQDSRAPLRGC